MGWDAHTRAHAGRAACYYCVRESRSVVIRENGRTRPLTTKGGRPVTRGNSTRTIIYCEIKKTATSALQNMAMARLASPQGSPACVGSSTADRPASAPGGFAPGERDAMHAMRCRNRKPGGTERQTRRRYGCDCDGGYGRTASNECVGACGFVSRAGRGSETCLEARDSAEGVWIGKVTSMGLGGGRGACWLVVGESQVCRWWVVAH